MVEFVRELDDLAGRRPITEDEFETAKLRKLRGYAQQFEAYGRVAGQVADPGRVCSAPPNVGCLRQPPKSVRPCSVVEL